MIEEAEVTPAKPKPGPPAVNPKPRSRPKLRMERGLRRVQIKV